MKHHSQRLKILALMIGIGSECVVTSYCDINIVVGCRTMIPGSWDGFIIFSSRCLRRMD